MNLHLNKTNNRMKKISLFLIICLIQVGLNAQENVTIGKYKKVDSKSLGGEVTYLVHLPDDYENSDIQYPVVYMMNSHIISAFANACATMDKLSIERIPDMILIGISNTGVARKYWCCPDSSGNAEHGEVFHNFLKEELIPEIDKNYRTNDYKILAGQSNTGLFVMYNLLFFPDLFNDYVIASPMFGWCPDFYLNKMKTFLNNNTKINNRLYMSYGDLDYVQVLDHIEDFKELLKQSPSGKEWKVDLIENTGHVPLITLNNALLFFFSECTMNAERRKFNVSDMKSHFNKLSEKYGFTVIPKAGALFDIALDLKNEKKFDQSVDIFQYLVSLYPDSELYFFFLGQTYQEKGDINLAKEYYNKSLKINSNFNSAKKALEKLNKLN